MNIHYDKIADAIYIKMNNNKISKTNQISDFIMHDIDKKGDLVGIEILNASKQTSPKVLQDSVLNGIPLKIVSATPERM